MKRSWLVWLCFVLAGQAPVEGQDTMAGFLEEEYSCIMCHTEMRVGFQDGVHSRRGILCTDCHGGDPTQFEVAAAHTADLRGGISKTEAVALCLSCHGDIPQMRQFALEPVTEEMFVFSRHGAALLRENNPLAPACGDCHGAHAILPRTDPRSPVHSGKIPETCSTCHSDPSRVPDGMAVDQMEAWAGSAHGEALLERHNEQSANCASCHGSHSALPPGVLEIPNVCGKCHQLVREAYFQGPHSQGVPCTACHANHETGMVAFSSIGTLCATCHDADSAEGVSGLELQEQVLRAEAAGERAREALRVLGEAGESIEDEEVRFLTLETHLNELPARAHALEASALDDLVRQIGSLATEIQERADVVEEHRWERKLLAIPFWLLFLGGILLALRKRRQLNEAEVEGTWGMGGGIES